MLASFCSLTERHPQWSHRKPHNDWLCTSINQEARRHDKTPVHTINIQSPMASVGESQVVDITPVRCLSITESRLVMSINHNVMLLWQFLPTICQIVSSTVPQCTGRLRQSTFSP